MNIKIKVLILILSGFLFTRTAFAALTCTVATTCTSPDVIIFKMHDITNSHSELPSQNNYSNLVCCGGVAGLSNTCADSYAVVLRLAGDTNAHAEENTQTTPPYDGHNVCMSVPSGTVTVGYQNNDCSGFDTIVASMATPPTNSHMGDASAYTTKVCASVSVPSAPPTSCSSIACAGGSLSTNNNSSTPIPTETKNEILKIADFNQDGKVDILDLSILLYYIAHPPADISPYDLNRDGHLDFLDISVLFYYWDVF